MSEVMDKTFICLLLLGGSLFMGGCERHHNPQKNAEGDSLSVVNQESVLEGVDCNIELGNVVFTKAINGADTLVQIKDDKVLEFRCGEKRDFFCDPNGGILSNRTAPLLLTKVDNAKSFTFISKVSPQFTEKDTYNAGDLFVFVNDTVWQKFAFEQDERGRRRIVTVRTRGTSDDNNHDEITDTSVYLKISSDTRTIASYYSTDKERWQLARLYKNDYPRELWVGICNQCPQGKGSVSLFEDISLEQNSVSDFRLGN